MIRSIPIMAVTTALASTLFAPVQPAAAETVYRCQNADGKTVFSDKPCGQNAEAVNVKLPTRPGAGIGTRCVIERDMKACAEYRKLRETHPDAWQEEYRRVLEAMRAQQMQQQQQMTKHQECVQRNMKMLTEQYRRLSNFQQSHISGRCYENSEIVLTELPEDPPAFRPRKRYVSP